MTAHTKLISVNCFPLLHLPYISRLAIEPHTLSLKHARTKTDVLSLWRFPPSQTLSCIVNIGHMRQCDLTCPNPHKIGTNMNSQVTIRTFSQPENSENLIYKFVCFFSQKFPNNDNFSIALTGSSKSFFYKLVN